MNVAFAIIPDTIWIGLIVAVTGAVTAVINNWIANKAEVKREAAEEARKLRDAEIARKVEEVAESATAAASVVARKTEEVKDVLATTRVVTDRKLDELAVNVSKTHDAVNSRVDEFKKLVTLQSERSLEEFKAMLAKATAFDATRTLKVEPVEVTVVNPKADPVNTKQTGDTK